MRHITDEAVRKNLKPKALIEQLRSTFQEEIHAPLRHKQEIKYLGEDNHNLLAMPAWGNSGVACIKLVNVVPGNSARQLPAVMSSVLVFSVETGEHLAIIDGSAVTSLRTACASALAADYLAKHDASTLLVVGSGSVGSCIPYAYQAVRELSKIILWDINLGASRKLAAKLELDGFNVSVVENLETAVSSVDMISCATLAQEPIVKGEWLQAGQHLDLIGSFLPEMRETNDTAVQRAEVFIDTNAALQESGDLIHPIESGILDEGSIRGNLSDLCGKRSPGRIDEAEITLFKSVGTSLEDLAAARLAIEVC